MRIWILVAVSVFATTLNAQGIRDGDQTLSVQELNEALAGNAVEFFDGSQAFFAADGSYEYRYRPDDPPFVGTFKASEDSQVCVTFDNGFSRCDTYVSSGGRLVLIIDDGTRFPVRQVSDWDGS